MLDSNAALTEMAAGAAQNLRCALAPANLTELANRRPTNQSATLAELINLFARSGRNQPKN
jgi:hypothetical protein